MLIKIILKLLRDFNILIYHLYILPVNYNASINPIGRTVS